MLEKLSQIETSIIFRGYLSKDILEYLQRQDPFCTVLINKITAGQNISKFNIFDKILYKTILAGVTEKRIPVLPDCLIPSIIHLFHTKLLHPSKTATANAIMHYFYNRKMAKHVRKLVNSCVVCKIAAEFPTKKTNPGADRTM